MIYALYSDIHNDRDGWRRLSRHQAFLTADRRICLGDVINAHMPEEAIKFYRQVAKASDAVVLGNHEAIFTGKCDIATFHPRLSQKLSQAKTWLTATEPQLVKEFARLPQRINLGEEAVATHGSFSADNPWRHIRYIEDVADEAAHTSARIAFLGHGHIPFIAYKKEGYWFYDRQAYRKPFLLDSDTPYIINIGSVLGSREMRWHEKTFVAYNDEIPCVTFYELTGYKEK